VLNGAPPTTCRFFGAFSVKFTDKKIIKRDYFVSTDRRWAAFNCEDFGRKFVEDGNLFLAQKN